MSRMDGKKTHRKHTHTTRAAGATLCATIFFPLTRRCSEGLDAFIFFFTAVVKYVGGFWPIGVFFAGYRSFLLWSSSTPSRFLTAVVVSLEGDQARFG